MYIAALCSGAAALIYQIVWSKTLALTFGSTTQGAAAVIAGFMIGMGIGARVYGARSNVSGNPARRYAYLELGIAFLGIVISPLLYQLNGLSGFIDLSGIVGRFAVAMAVLLLPAALMGATFPALCHVVIATNSELSNRLGLVYGMNTIGAALGALVAGFLLIENFGGSGSVWIAAGLNVIAACIAWTSTKRRAQSAALPVQSSQGAMVASVIPERMLVAVAFLSALGTLAYEIVWFRAAKYLIGNSTYAMSIVLSVFLLGLGLGGILEKRLARRAKLDLDLMRAQIAIALASLLSAGLLYAAINWSPLQQQLSVFAPAVMTRPWEWRLLWSLVATVVLILPPTVLMGLTFPIVVTLVTRSVDRLGQGVGRVYLSSNLGATAGAILGAVVMLPILGTMGSLKAAVALNIALACLLALYLKNHGRREFITLCGLVALGIALSVVLPQRMDFKGEIEGASARTLFEKEGDLATVKVLVANNNVWKGMTIDGYAIGIDRSLARDVTFKQLLLAHLPPLLNPEAKSVLNIGLGSATTHASLASYTMWERIDCVEISAAVAEGARFFDDGRSLDDPRSHLYIEDAVQFLNATDLHYDVIVADGKQNHQFPGNATLLSRELFASAKSRLHEGGIMVQWIPLGFPERSFDAIARTFASVFEDMSVYYYPPEAVILVGGRDGLPDSLPEEMTSRFADDLGLYLIDSRERLLAGWVADGVGLRGLLGAEPINTWDRPILEFWPYRDFEARRAVTDKGRNLELLSRAGVQSRNQESAAFVSEKLEIAGLVRRAYTEYFKNGSPIEFSLRVDSALTIDPSDRMALGLRELLQKGPAALQHTGPL